MEAYRLTHFRYADDLSGFGAFKAGGRWNPKGYYALYLSEHPSAAILETLIHLPPQILPDDYQMVTVHIADTQAIDRVSESELPAAWRQGGYDLTVFQDFGKRRLYDTGRLGLCIPSSVAYPAKNYILNPGHEMFKSAVSITGSIPYIFDPRLLKRLAFHSSHVN